VGKGDAEKKLAHGKGICSSSAKISGQISGMVLSKAVGTANISIVGRRLSKRDVMDISTV